MCQGNAYSVLVHIFMHGQDKHNAKLEEALSPLSSSHPDRIHTGLFPHSENINLHQTAIPCLPVLRCVFSICCAFHINVPL